MVLNLICIVGRIVVKEVKDQESCVPLARYPNTIKDSVLFCDIDTEGQCQMHQESPKRDYMWKVTTMDGYRFGTGPDLGQLHITYTLKFHFSIVQSKSVTNC